MYCCFVVFIIDIGTTLNLINSTYGADASVLVQMNTESAQTTCMHCYKFQNTYRHHVFAGPAEANMHWSGKLINIHYN